MPEPTKAAATLWDTFDAMDACLRNNSAEARRRAQFRNVMESLVRTARAQANKALREARSAPLTPTERILMHLRRRGTSA